LAKITELSKSYLNEIEKGKNILKPTRLFFGRKVGVPRSYGFFEAG
jgi:hypothetical protein